MIWLFVTKKNDLTFDFQEIKLVHPISIEEIWTWNFEEEHAYMIDSLRSLL